MFYFCISGGVFPNSWIPLGWCHRANVSVMLFILDKLKDLWKNFCRLRRHPRLNCGAEGTLFFDNEGWSESWRNVIKISQLEIYWNTCRFLFVFPFTTQDPILSTGIRHHGDKTARERASKSERERGERARWRPAGDAATAGDNCSFECNIFTGLSLSLPPCPPPPHTSLNLGFSRRSRNALNPRSVVCDFLDISMQPVIQLKHNMLWLVRHQPRL